MGLEDKLIQVDKFIWKGFEKVTQYAYKHGGYSKYDLAQVCDTASSIGITGYGVYCFAEFYNFNHTLENLSWLGMAMGAILTVAGYIGYSTSKKYNLRTEETETNEILRTGAVRQPMFTFFRPLYSLCISTIVVGSMFKDQVPKMFKGTANEYYQIENLITTCFSFWCYGNIGAQYFRSQIMQPPKAKKSVWKALYETVTKPFQKLKPAPQPESVENFSSD